MSGILAEMHGPKQRGWSFALALSTLTFLASCTTQDSGSCLTARDCPVDHQCVGSMCEPVAGGTDGTCVTSDDCGLGEFCDTNTGMCKAFTTTACTEDSQCPPTQRC